MKKGIYTNWTVEVLRNYFENRCEFCGGTNRLDLHHKIPLRSGGINILANIQLLCDSCHRKVHSALRIIYPPPIKEFKKNVVGYKEGFYYLCATNGCNKMFFSKKNIKRPFCRMCKRLRDNEGKIQGSTPNTL